LSGGPVAGWGTWRWAGNGSIPKRNTSSRILANDKGTIVGQWLDFIGEDKLSEKLKKFVHHWDKA